MRTLKISVFSCGLLTSISAFAADSSSDPADQPPPLMKLGGGDPAGVGPLTVAPSEVHLPVSGPSQTDDFVFDYHGYFRVPLSVSMGSRTTTGEGQSGTTFHVPAVVPGGSTRYRNGQVLGNWLSNNTLGGPWANARFSYGNKTVTGVVGLSAFQFSAAQDSGQNNNNVAVGLGPVYLHFNMPNFLGSKARVDWDVGAFGDRYGTAGKYDYGAYGMFLIGATGAVGERFGAEMDAGSVTFRLEHGLGGNYYIDKSAGSTLLHHAHLFAGSQVAKVGVHYMTAWTTDERQPVAALDPTGRVSVVGADARFNGGAFGELYFGAAQVKATHAKNVGPVIYTIGALGGQGLRDNFFGPESDSGSVTTILAQYDYSLVTLLRYMAHYPKAYWTDGPDLKISLFGTMSKVKSDIDTQGLYDGATKSKLGAELIYSPLPWLSVAGRFDRVNPTSKDPDQAFSVISPRVMFKSAYFSHELVTLQYSRYSYGSKPATVAGPPATDDIYNPKLDPALANGQVYDKDVIYLSASMWW